MNAAEFDGLMARNQLVKGDTIEAVCEPLGVDAAELEKTVGKWNGYCKDGKDPDFNYRAAMHPIEGGPYYLLAYKLPCITRWAVCISTPTRAFWTTRAIPFPVCLLRANRRATRWERTAWDRARLRISSCSVA